MKVTLEAARVNAGMTQMEAAKTFGVKDVATFRRIEKGIRDLSVKEAQKLCEMYNCTASDIIWPKNSQIGE